MRLHVRILLPQFSAVVLKRPLAIIDTPGLDSPRVWEQLHSLIYSKAFLFAWVGDLTSATVFGKEGQQLVNLLLTQRQPVPPLLILTKWEEIKDRKEFRAAQRRKEHVVKRVQDLLRGLCLSKSERCCVKVSDGQDLDRLMQALPKEAVSPDFCSALPVLKSSGAVALAAATVLGGTRLKQGDKLISPLEVLQSRELPAHLEFQTRSHACRPLIAATNAQAVLATCGLELDEQKGAATEVDDLLQQLIDLMTAVGEPMRRTKQIFFVRTAVQELTNVVLEQDPRAVAHTEDYMECLRRFKDEGLQNFTLLVDQYFAQLPANAAALTVYKPLSPLEKVDATQRLASIIENGLARADIKKLSDCEQILKVAEMTFDEWKMSFEKTLRVLDAQSFTRLHAQAHCILEDFNEERSEFAVAHFRSNFFFATAGVGVFAGMLCVLGGAALAASVPVAGPLCLLGSCAMMFAGVGSWVSSVELELCAKNLLIKNPALSKVAGAEEYCICTESKIESITTAVLQTLIRGDFQALAKKHAVDARKKALEQSLQEFGKLRSARATDTEYAHSAVSLQAELRKYMLSLDEWLSYDLASRAGNRAWLTSQNDLRELLKDLPEFENLV
eukprot:s102_g9.t1